MAAGVFLISDSFVGSVSYGVGVLEKSSKAVISLADVFARKVSDSEFLYSNMKFLLDVVDPVLSYAVSSSNVLGKGFIDTVKGPLKGWTGISTLPKTVEVTIDKIKKFIATPALSSFIDAVGILCGLGNKMYDVISFAGDRWNVVPLKTLSGVFLEKSFLLLGVGSVFRSVMAADNMWACFYGSGPLGSRQPSNKPYERGVNYALKLGSGVAAAIAGTTLFLKSIKAIEPELADLILLPTGMISTSLKISQYYYEDIQGLSVRS